jgi:hypothetical protein
MAFTPILTQNCIALCHLTNSGASTEYDLFDLIHVSYSLELGAFIGSG